MNKNKIKKYLKETFVVESYINNYKYNIKLKNGTPMDTDNIVWRYVDNHGGEDGWFKSDDGHWVQIDDNSKYIVTQIRSMNEDTKPVGLKATEKAQKESDKFNKDNQKEVGSKMSDYGKGPQNEKDNSESVKKYENSEDEQDYHNMKEIMNGQEMIKYDNPPNEIFKDRAIKAIEGHTSMGNSPDYANVVTADQAGFTGPEFGKQLVARARMRVDLDIKGTQNYDGMGDVAIPKGPNKAEKQIAFGNKINENKKNKMKRLRFKKPFNGVGNALQLIPENYKVDDKTFHMTDGNENYEIRWEGSLNEGRAVVLKAEDKNMISENMSHMKHLMNYNSKDTLGEVKGSARLDENRAFSDVFNKTKVLLENKGKKNNILTESDNDFSGPSIKGLPVNTKGNNTDTDFPGPKIDLPLTNNRMGNDDDNQLPEPPEELHIGENNDRFDDVFDGFESIDEELRGANESENGEYYVVGTNRGDEVDGMEIKDYDVVTGYEKEEIERNNRYASFNGPYFSEREAYEALESAENSKLSFIKHGMDDDDYGKGNNRVIDPLDKFELGSLDSESDF